MLVASLAARRFGHAVGGTIAGLPMIAGPIMGFVLLQQPAAAAQAIALATLACLPATVLHMICFAWSATRWPWYVALLVANGVFLAAGAALVAANLPWTLVCFLAVAAPVAGRFAMPRLRLAPGAVHLPRAELACRVLAAMLMAGLIIRSAGGVPAQFSGLLLAIPITGNVLPCFTLPRHGAAATTALLTGFVRGLAGFAAFFVALVLALPELHPGAAYALAWVVALMAAIALYGLARGQSTRP